MATLSPTISVVMAVFNGEGFLQQAMESILNQTFSNFELIVVDDGSTDRTSEILDSFTDHRIIRLTNSKNIGQTRSLNIGLAKARGRFIARHDADDLSDPDRFARQVVFMESHPEIGLLGTAYDIYDTNGRKLETIAPPSDNSQLQKRLEQGNTFCHGSVMMRSDVVTRVSGYNENFPVAQDYEFWLRLAEVSEIANLADPLYKFRLNKESISRTSRNRQLAYKELAWSFARRRRSGEADGTIPEDVLIAFPPDRNKLRLEARGTAYLYFAAGQLEQAENAIQQSFELQSSAQGQKDEWQRWGVSRAIHLADIRDDVIEGENFLKWLVEQLAANGLKVNSRIMFGDYFVDRAFQAYQKRNSSQVRACTWRAISSDWRYLRNRGLWSIYLHSIR